jgi:hypothetical protein
MTNSDKTKNVSVFITATSSTTVSVNAYPVSLPAVLPYFYRSAIRRRQVHETFAE